MYSGLTKMGDLSGKKNEIIDTVCDIHPMQKLEECGHVSFYLTLYSNLQ